MDATSLIYLLLIGAISGWLAGQFWQGSGFGLVGNIIAGIVGSFVGGYVARLLHIGDGSLLWTILISAGGAWLVLFAASLIKRA